MPKTVYLYLLIAYGCNDIQELATCINATQRTVERNFKILADLGLIYSKTVFYYASDDNNVAEGVLILKAVNKTLAITDSD